MMWANSKESNRRKQRKRRKPPLCFLCEEHPRSRLGLVQGDTNPKRQRGLGFTGFSIAGFVAKEGHNKLAQKLRLVASVMAAAVARPFPLRLPRMLAKPGVAGGVLRRLDDGLKTESAGDGCIFDADHH